MAEPKRDKLEIFNEALKDAANEPKAEAVTRKASKKSADEAGRGARRRLPSRRPRAEARPRRPSPRLPAAEEAAPVPADETPEGAADAAETAETAAGRRRRQERRGLTVLAEALEHLVRGVVDHPDDVTVRDKQTRRGPLLEVRVHPDDLGKVIGRGGRTATAFRTVISALAGRGGSRIDFVDVDRVR